MGGRDARVSRPDCPQINGLPCDQEMTASAKASALGACGKKAAASLLQGGFRRLRYRLRRRATASPPTFLPAETSLSSRVQTFPPTAFLPERQ